MKRFASWLYISILSSTCKVSVHDKKCDSNQDSVEEAMHAGTLMNLLVEREPNY